MLFRGPSTAFRTFLCIKTESSYVPVAAYGLRFAKSLHVFEVMTTNDL